MYYIFCTAPVFHWTIYLSYFPNWDIDYFFIPSKALEYFQCNCLFSYFTVDVFLDSFWLFIIKLYIYPGKYRINFNKWYFWVREAHEFVILVKIGNQYISKAVLSIWGTSIRFLFLWQSLAKKSYLIQMISFTQLIIRLVWGAFKIQTSGWPSGKYELLGLEWDPGICI